MPPDSADNILYGDLERLPSVVSRPGPISFTPSETGPLTSEEKRLILREAQHIYDLAEEEDDGWENRMIAASWTDYAADDDQSEVSVYGIADSLREGADVLEDLAYDQNIRTAPREIRAIAKRLETAGSC